MGPTRVLFLHIIPRFRLSSTTLRLNLYNSLNAMVLI
jgi:hypothetical protein